MRLAELATLLRDDGRPNPGPVARERLIPGFRQAFFEDPLDQAPGPEGGKRAWREAAVLILLYPDERGEAAFPLIQRPEGSGNHAGQIALPGGAREPGEDFGACALRECAEELGVNAESVRLLRELSVLPVPPSCFLVHPFIGLVEEKPLWRPAPAEVDGVLEALVEALFRPDAIKEYEAEFGGAAWRVPYYAISGARVWGATAMILAEFAALLAPAKAT